MEHCISDNGKIDFFAYEALTTKVPLRDFLDLEELAMCASDRKVAWEQFIKQHPELFEDDDGPNMYDEG